ncbi:Proteasome subunit alpha type-3 [Porphyridium purpureum]|uniref:Proteasome subunit alpha type n=1 Tax=Porphyridium purpureum TaxID=35688 RepID=A0A5J4YYU5_PORPP|nr:Proteasome subunit alpha type-3 [Porphyridium purpureum]|eukprot:POR9688..scf209_3
MSGIGTGYDLSTTTFSPDGRVFQVEYSSKAVENSGTLVGVRCKDGVVMAIEKIVTSKMMVKGSCRRCHIVDLHAGLSVAGMGADGRVIVDRARQEAAQYRSIYGIEIPGRVLAERIASFVHMYSLYWFVRPFGCAVMFGSYSEEEGPQLYVIEPSGIVYRYFAYALGKGKQIAKTELEKIKFDEITCREAIKELTNIIVGKCRDESRDKAFELEMLWICDESLRKCQLVPSALVDEALELAKAAAESDDEDME